MKKALLGFATMAVVIGATGIDSESWIPAIMAIAGAAYIFLSVVANWNDIVRKQN